MGCLNNFFIIILLKSIYILKELKEYLVKIIRKWPRALLATINISLYHLFSIYSKALGPLAMRQSYYSFYLFIFQSI